MLAGTLWASPAPAGVLTFSDQDGDSGPLSRGGNTANANTFTTAHGTPPGVTATFDGFNRVGPNATWLDFDHTGGPDWRAVVGTSDTALITFSAPVAVDRIWIKNDFGNWPGDPSDPDGYLVRVRGIAPDNAVAWEYAYEAATFDDFTDQFFPVVTGTGKTVLRVEFENLADVAFDDLSVVAVPEPTGIWALAVGGMAAAARRRRRRRVCLRRVD
ncbi:MAG TPA: PEP-CTERM sorting domain-containing protein [Tepidisphaeraceae bacterium]|nr:PEP-CTERM sorting domain-containing protein [Tepidisphaeraceae bacterium]